MNQWTLVYRSRAVSEMTKNINDEIDAIVASGAVPSPHLMRDLSLSRRLDALEAAKGKKEAGAHEAGCPAALCDGPCICPVAQPQPSGNTGELKESVGERWALDHVCQGDAGLYITNHDGTMRSDAMTLMLVNARMWIAAAINAAVAEANARADAANHEVRMAAQNRDKWKDAFDVLREDHNALCDGLNAALDAHGIKWKDNSTYAGFMESALTRAEKAEAEVKRLSDPGWITHMSCHNSTYAAFARHVKGGGA